MKSIITRVGSLELRAGNHHHWLCPGCRDMHPPCRHVAGYLALMPRVEASSDEEWHATRQLALRVLEGRP